ncbi:TPA: riboflavin synthase [Candidatus Woesearchaeota archaeon]|nr:MAG: riboflavin synthase [archaeon GW2011_AR4]HIH38878.1 riboflavin synthase [Candidatus Woesearchaeota archaeon]HIH48700.1 riboflavin synthase [Candidatus Woesearchaeota archaeon]HIJ03784.1 riboflavin synthase [Candidatus Woesearchaeota archaeon]
MASFAIGVLKESAPNIQIERYTVPGFKDLPVAAKKLIEEYNCEIVLAFGFAGKAEIDLQCAHEANMGLIQAELMTNTHILKVFVYSDEAKNEKGLHDIAKDRSIKHTLNAIALMQDKEMLTPFAGKGKRQGFPDEGPIAR